MKTILGTCGHCGGSVSVPTVYMSLVSPTPACDDCGRRPAAAHGPVIPMESGEPRSLRQRIGLAHTVSLNGRGVRA
jgi:hypothetical protein